MIREKLNSSRQTDRQTDRRNYNVDFIRVMACSAVVGLHTFPKDLSTVTASLYYLCGFAVPVFFMSSGYFLLNRGEVSYKYAVQKCIGIIRVVFLWNSIIFILKFAKQLILDEEVTINLMTLAKEFVKSFVQWGTLWQFWYLGALLIIYALLLVLSRRNCRQKRAVLLICGIVSVVVEAASFLYGMPLQKNVIQTFRVWTWLFYFLLGSEMPKAKDWFCAHVNMISHFIICLAVTVLIVAYQNYVGSKIILEATGVLHAEYFYDSLFEMIWIVLIVTLLLRINFSSRFTDCIFRLAPLTMGIYIMHPMVLKVTLAIIGNTSIFRSIVYWIATLFGAIIITWGIRKIPLGKYLVKI